MSRHASDLSRNPPYGRLTAKKNLGRTPEGDYLWLCDCACGNVAVVRSSLLASRSKHSCGCLGKESYSRRRSPKRQQAIELVAQGLSYAQVGKELGVSRQRVHQYIREKEILREEMIHEEGTDSSGADRDPQGEGP